MTKIMRHAEGPAIARGTMLALVLASAVNATALAQEGRNPGDIPDAQAFFVYRGAGFHVDVPEGWSRRTTPHGVIFALRTYSLEIETGGRPPGGGTRVQLAHAVALRQTGRELGASDPVTGKRAQLERVRYVFSRNGRTVVLTLRGPAGADNADVWRRIADSFAWT
jgi:hypothetical protein